MKLTKSQRRQKLADTVKRLTERNKQLLNGTYKPTTDNYLEVNVMKIKEVK